MQHLSWKHLVSYLLGKCILILCFSCFKIIFLLQFLKVLGLTKLFKRCFKVKHLWFQKGFKSHWRMLRMFMFESIAKQIHFVNFSLKSFSKCSYRKYYRFLLKRFSLYEIVGYAYLTFHRLKVSLLRTHNEEILWMHSKFPFWVEFGIQTCLLFQMFKPILCKFWIDLEFIYYLQLQYFNQGQ